MIKIKKLLFTVILLAACSMSVFAQNGVTDDATELSEKLKTDQLSIGMLLQSVGSFSFQDDNFNGGRQFGLGATRLDVQGALPSNFIYRLQLEFRNNPSVLDAEIGYKFSESFTLIAGQSKPFLSADLDPSPANTDFINRARLVGSMMSTRERGLTAIGKAGQFNYALGMYNGFGRTALNDNRFFYTARAGYTHELNTGDLNFSVNLGLNTSENAPVGSTGLSSTDGRFIYGAFVKYDSDSWFGTVEFLQTDFEQSFSGIDETITGFYITAGNNLTEVDQVLARWDHLSFDQTGQSSDRFVLGWNRQISSLISFQLNMLGQFNEFTDDQFGLSGNLQLYF